MIELEVRAPDEVRLETIDGGVISLDASEGSTPPTYRGDYTVTPSESTQVLSIRGKMAISDITIEPIPNNYGLVTWNGSVLRIS